MLKEGSKLRNHFLISDNFGFRIEEKYDEPRGKGLHLAKSKASFNTPEACERLHEIFDFAFNPKPSQI